MLKLWGDYNLYFAEIWICWLTLCVTEIAMANALWHAESSQIWSFGHNSLFSLLFLSKFTELILFRCISRYIVGITKSFDFCPDFLRNSDHIVKSKMNKYIFCWRGRQSLFACIRGKTTLRCHVPPCLQRLCRQYERQSKLGCPTETTLKRQDNSLFIRTEQNCLRQCLSSFGLF